MAQQRRWATLDWSWLPGSGRIRGSRLPKTTGRAHQAHHLVRNQPVAAERAMAENEILWWSGFGIRSVIEQGLQQMWQTGPRGEHYGIMVGSSLRLVAGFS